MLDLVKPVYGLCDAPLLWQLGLLDYLRNTMQGQSSSLDDNFLFWRKGSELKLLITIHVDDLLVAGCLLWMAWAWKLLTQRFGEMKRQALPFQHNRLEYDRLGATTLRISQRHYLEKIPEAKVIGSSSLTRLSSQPRYTASGLCCALCFGPFRPISMQRLR